MPWNLKCYYGSQDLHFLTYTCYRRLPLLSSARARNVFVEILAEVRDGYGFLLAGYVVMPNHVHLLIGEPAKGTPSTVMQVLKQRVSRRLRARKRRAPQTQLQLAFVEGELMPRQFWQRRFHDFNLWSHKKIIEKLEYVHMNPVKNNLVEHSKHRAPRGPAKDWPWSSWSYYAKGEQGLVRIDESS
ncbi:MAG: transposase [Candidatus Acidiferrales bacterium]